VSLTGASTDNPTFEAPLVAMPTTFTFQLKVTDATSAFATDTVDVVVEPPPALVANAGAMQNTTTGATVSLHATATGGVPPYTWAWTGPTGITFANLNTANPTFKAPTTAGTVTLTVTVTDSLAAKATSTVDVVVAAKALRCSQCEGLACLLNPSVKDCPAADQVCLTTVVDVPARKISRGCAVPMNPPVPRETCKQIENAAGSGETCNFYCGIDECNMPPSLIPSVGRIPDWK
jgi:hypothetical protein